MFRNVDGTERPLTSGLGMNAELLVAFLVAAPLLVLSPGPVNVLVMAHATAYGWRPAMATNAGACVSLAVQLVFMALGVGTLLLLLGDWFVVLRWAGAGYVVYLGVEQWRAASRGQAEELATPSRASMFWQGVLVSSTNPKSLLLFPVFFPQFVDPARPASFQLAVLGLTFLAISMAGFALLGALAHRLRPFLRAPWRARLRDRLFGGVLILLGIGLAVRA